MSFVSSSATQFQFLLKIELCILQYTQFCYDINCAIGLAWFKRNLYLFMHCTSHRSSDNGSVMRTRKKEGRISQGCAAVHSVVHDQLTGVCGAARVLRSMTRGRPASCHEGR